MRSKRAQSVKFEKPSLPHRGIIFCELRLHNYLLRNAKLWRKSHGTIFMFQGVADMLRLSAQYSHAFKHNRSITISFTNKRFIPVAKNTPFSASHAAQFRLKRRSRSCRNQGEGPRTNKQSLSLSITTCAQISVTMKNGPTSVSVNSAVSMPCREKASTGLKART